ncbi:S16 family serine protease [Demequina sp.]|uniref:YlbL family protein n=1 Tax=Demequina sp. TaxID=2050685 RepID=UPI0025B9F7FA|nr:S16 family serine protease [Demequina sp.]
MSEPRDDVHLSLSEQPPSRRANVMAATGLAASLLLAALTVVPSQYAIEGPGPTFDTLSASNDVPLVQIDGATTYPSSGELRLTTVSVSDASTQRFTVGAVIEAFFSPSRTVQPVEAVLGSPQDQKASEDRSAQQWITSQESATVSALEALGHEVPAKISVVEVLDESNAKGKLEVGDVLVAAGGKGLVSYRDLTEYLDSHQAGDAITLTVRRAGDEVTVSFDLIDYDGAARMGITVDPRFDPPIDVTVGIDKVGGPSAGMMFALAIMDQLTPDDELHGSHVAGTGVVDVDGQVYPIGGIALKMLGARAAGADYFLAPVENCDEVLGHVPDGLDVYSVDTLDDAYAAIVAIGKKDTSVLPRCNADNNKG